MSVLDALPDRPLSDGELSTLREGDPVVEAAPLARAEDGIRHLGLQVDGSLYGIGYDDEGGWVVDERTAGDPDDLAALREELHAWATADGS